ncbi:gliding motility-associated C-terminal domain-containing protein, partial [Flavobacterium sp. LB3P21]|uniref:gliding motility-associated C-terminal domain-containing protein n=1 Tax=Flavobacterium sp. LB3P21 TaxID=3401719 RepID=UPI003AAEB29A
TTCQWKTTGTQPAEPTTALACWETRSFDTASCTWKTTGTQPAEPTTALACWETRSFDTASCTWKTTGTQPAEPTTALACWETRSFDTTTCQWKTTGTQPAEPVKVNCWNSYTFNTTTCAWVNNNTVKPAEPAKVNCWDTYTFSTTTCAWEVTGTKPEPTLIEKTVCNTDSSITIDLNTLLSPETPNNGTWINNSSAVLNGNIFSPFNLPDADYNFEYKYQIVNEQCPRSIFMKITLSDNDCSIVLGCGVIDVHNAFSPNGDGTNEAFVIENIENILCYPDNTVEIYNRWGVLVYETNGYNNTSKAFTGLSKGRTTIGQSQELPTGTYFYILNYTSIGENSQIQTNKKDGYLYLIR